jgi:hypothetical protein
VKIIQPSPHELICRKDGNIRETIRNILGTTTFLLVVGLLYSLFSPSKQGYSLFPFNNIIYLIFCFIAIAVTHNHIAIFDLARQSIRIERYFTLFKKCHRQDYDISIIKNIVAEKYPQSGEYRIVLKQICTGKDIYLPSPHYCGDILIVDAEAQKIRDFLGLNNVSSG